MDPMVSERIAVIPARGGSKRLPYKNILDFMGKPMIAWTIETAQNTDLFDMILVSTDSEEIAEVAKNYGAHVPFLRNKHSDDHSTVSEATITALTQLKGYNGKEYKTVVQLMANCPVRSSDSVKSQLHKFEEQNDRNSILSGFEYGMFNPWWAHIKDEKGKYKKLLRSYTNDVRSQDLPKLICPTGATWVSDVEKLMENKSFYSPNYGFYKIPWIEAVDIDNSDDLQLARAAYLIYNGNL